MLGGAGVVNDGRSDAAAGCGLARGAAAVSTYAGAVPCALFLASGFASLVYEVLWLRALGVLFGQTAAAAGLTLAVFLGGMALGAELGGRRRATLRTYAGLELAIGVTALASVALLEAGRGLSPGALAWLGARFPGQLVLALGLVGPSAVLIGATLPVMVQAVAPMRGDLGRATSMLYAANTLGAALGALAAGFTLVPVLGVRGAYGAAMAVNALVAAAAFAVARREEEGSPVAPDVIRAAPVEPNAGGAAAALAAPGAGGAGAGLVASVSSAARADLFTAVAFASGFAVLALEVLWTRMLAQVLHNSVHSFAAILATVLLALAVGALVAGACGRLVARPERVLAALLLASGISVAVTPPLFVWWTDGLAKLGGDRGWAGYLGSVGATVAVVTAGPAIAAGAVFPFLLRVAEAGRDGIGRVVGRLAAVNTAGAIAGSLAAGFLLPGTVGLWASIRAVAVLYLLLALVVPDRGTGGRLLRVAAGAVLLLLVSVADPARLPIVALDPAKGERLVEVVEGSAGIVSVVERRDDLRLKVDNHYSLGGSAGRALEGVQADLPLALAARARSVYFLGVGTGITAGAALRHPVEQVTAVELIPEVLTAARRHFAPFIGGLFEDPRVTLVTADGRQHLAASDARFDVVVSDLFVPWQAGAASLYSREHFATVRAHLADGGLFAQWLPLYQVSERELAIVARTMLEVFPQVTLWRGDFQPDHPIVALVGQEAGAALDPETLAANVHRIAGSARMDERTAVAFTALTYAGNLSLNEEIFRAAPVNTDDRPVLEDLAPRTHRDAVAGRAGWLTLGALDAFYARLFARVPPEDDPYLARLTPEQIAWVRAGASLHRAFTWQHVGRAEEAAPLVERFREAVPWDVYTAFRERIALLP